MEADGTLQTGYALSNMNYFQNIPSIDVQNVVNAVNSALAVDLDGLSHPEDYDAIDPSIENPHYYTDLSKQKEEGLLRQDALAGVDPKKMCPFCGRAFLHPGSLGRHLDLKKGTQLHPANEVERLRGNVKRRGDKVEVQNRRRIRTKEYNSRQDVRERNRVRRRLKDRQNRAKNTAQRLFLSRMGSPLLGPLPSFARLVAFFLPPSQWPVEVPDKSTYALLEGLLSPVSSAATARSATGSSSADLLAEHYHKLTDAFAAWCAISREAQGLAWNREIRAALEATLGGLSLYDVASRDLWIDEESKRQESLLYSEANDNTDAELEDVTGIAKRPVATHEYYQTDETAVALAAAVAAAVAGGGPGQGYLGEKSMAEIMNGE